MAKPFRIQGVIGDEFQTADLQAFLDAAGGAPVNIEINSPGGSVFVGLEAYNALAEYPGLVTITCTALAASAASLIFMAGDRRLMLDGSMLMVHRSTGLTVGNTDAHGKTAAVLAKIDQQVNNIYSKTTGLPLSRVKALCDDETWMDQSQAVKLGFATEASVEAVSANIAGFDLTKYRNPPARLVALASPNPKRKTPMAKKPAPIEEEEDGETIVVDTTGTILASAAAAGLSAKATADIVLEAKGDVSVARAAIIAAVAKKSGDNQHIQMGDGAGGDEAGHNALIGAAFDAKLLGKSPTGPLHGISNVGIAAEFLRARGIKLVSNDGVSTMQQAFGVRRTFMSSGFETTSDLPGILGDSMHKSLQALFVAADDGVSKIASTGTMDDFRPKSIGKLSSFPGLELVNEAGEITQGVLDEGGEKIAVATFARGISVSLQVMVNDNLGAVQRSLRDVAFATVNLKASLILTALLSTKMSDGKTLFEVAHGNIVDSEGPSIAGLSAMRTIMRQQKALDGTTVLGLAPKIVLVPSALETAAQLVTAAISPVATEAVNPFSGSIIVAAEPRLDAIDPAAWFGFADPNIMPAVEFATLAGTPGPRLEIQNPASFDRLGTSYRVWWACGAAPIEWRAAVKNTGIEATA